MEIAGTRQWNTAPATRPQTGSGSRWKTVVLRTLLIGAVLYSVALGCFYYAMCQPPEVFGRVMMRVGPTPFLLFPFETMWKHARAGSLVPGSEAPLFELPRLDGSGTVALAQFRRKQPVVLVFGSYT